jgi:crotonobetainyl-CoA:carnitine CoA-transferase CaiB-like acyl-CoA transferase
MERRSGLSDLRVLDLSMGWAGPFVSFLLAELGAEVIKVEGRRRFDWWRGPHPNDAARNADGTINVSSHEQAPVFNSVNRHKRGITLDLTARDGRGALLDLVRISDLLIENFTPHAMAGLELDYPVLAAVNPQIVMLSMPAFGSTGPERDYIGYGMTIEAMAGMTALAGYENGPPHMLANAYGDPVSGLNGAVAALVALRQCRRTGCGSHVEVAQVEGFIPMVAGALLDRQMNGRDGRRHGNRHPSMAPHNVYPCKGDDAWVSIAVGSDRDWAALCGAIGCPALIHDTRFADVVSRKRNEDLLDPMLSAWTLDRSRDEAVATLRSAGVPVAPVQTSADLIADAQLAARAFFSVVDRAEVGAHPYPGLPFSLQPASTPDPCPAPQLGEDSRMVLTALLAVTEGWYEALSAAGVTGAGLADDLIPKVDTAGSSGP